MAVAPAPPQAPPTSNVAEFPTGRYELRGDGVSTPYTWVWIPNPPTSPPPARLRPRPRGSELGERPGTSARAGQLYRWTDAQGVVYWTDRLDAVPEQYRSKVKAHVLLSAELVVTGAAPDLDQAQARAPLLSEKIPKDAHHGVVCSRCGA